MAKPTRFEDLGVEELRRSAIADFAVEVDPKDNKKLVLAALTEGGVSWSDYVAQHPEVAPEEPAVVASAAPVDPGAPVPAVVTEREPEAVRAGATVTSPNGAVDSSVYSAEYSAERVVVAPEPVIHVATEPVAAPQDKFLIKMDGRDNPLYEVLGYRFTKEYPYALVSPAEADYILRNESGFRQAFPSELQDFYDM